MSRRFMFKFGLLTKAKRTNKSKPLMSKKHLQAFSSNTLIKINKKDKES